MAHAPDRPAHRCPSHPRITPAVVSYAAAVPLVLGVSFGPHATLAEVRDADTGQLVSTGRMHHAELGPHAEDPTAWWRSLTAAISRCRRAPDRRASSVSGGHPGLVLLDGAGVVLRPDAAVGRRSGRGRPAAPGLRRGALGAAGRGASPTPAPTVTRLTWLRSHRPADLRPHRHRAPPPRLAHLPAGRAPGHRSGQRVVHRACGRRTPGGGSPTSSSCSPPTGRSTRGSTACPRCSSPTHGPIGSTRPCTSSSACGAVRSSRPAPASPWPCRSPSVCTAVASASPSASAPPCSPRSTSRSSTPTGVVQQPRRRHRPPPRRGLARAGGATPRRRDGRAARPPRHRLRPGRGARRPSPGRRLVLRARSRRPPRRGLTGLGAGRGSRRLRPGHLRGHRLRGARRRRRASPRPARAGSTTSRSTSPGRPTGSTCTRRCWPRWPGGPWWPPPASLAAAGACVQAAAVLQRRGPRTWPPRGRWATARPSIPRTTPTATTAGPCTPRSRTARTGPGTRPR